MDVISLPQEGPNGSNPDAPSLQCTIAPWLSVRDGARAIEFYQAAFGATEAYRMEDPGGGVVVKLSVDGAEFWVSGGVPEPADFSPESLGGGSVRMILTVADPDAVFARALAAGATEVFPVGEEYGWRLGRRGRTPSGITGRFAVRLPRRRSMHRSSEFA